MTTNTGMTLAELADDIAALDEGDIRHIVRIAIDDIANERLDLYEAVEPEEDPSDPVTFDVLLCIGRHETRGVAYQFMPSGSDPLEAATRDALLRMLKASFDPDTVMLSDLEALEPSPIATYCVAALGEDDEGRTVLRAWSHPDLPVAKAAMMLIGTIERVLSGAHTA